MVQRWFFGHPSMLFQKLPCFSKTSMLFKTFHAFLTYIHLVLATATTWWSGSGHGKIWASKSKASKPRGSKSNGRSAEALLLLEFFGSGPDAVRDLLLSIADKAEFTEPNDDHMFGKLKKGSWGAVEREMTAKGHAISVDVMQ